MQNLPALAVRNVAPDVVIVLGMHRSGTSAVTRGLQTLGCALGDKLMQPALGVNDKGFWEDLDIYRLNEDLLADIGSSWNSCQVLTPERLAAPTLRRHRETAKRLLQDKLQHKRPFAFKDPRTAMLLPFWKAVLDDLNLSAAYVIVIRNPLEVSQSLARRDAFANEQSLLLWYLHNRSALDNTEGQRRIVVHYANVLAEPLKELKRIASGLQLSAPDANDPAVLQYIGDFLDSDLRHGRLSDNALLNDASVPEEWKDLYRRLLSMATDTDVFGHRQLEKDTAERELLLRYIGTLEHDFIRGRQSEQRAVDAAKAAQDESQSLRSEVATLKGEQERVLEAMKAAQDESQSLRAEMVALADEITAMAGSKSWRYTYPFRKMQRSLRHRAEEIRAMRRRIRGWLRQRSQRSVQPEAKPPDVLPAESSTPGPVACQQVLPPLFVPHRRLSEALPRPVRMVAFYLPQYHEIPENNLWWRKGFTEWSNSRLAAPLFPGHYQPHVPLHGYYDLTDPTVMPKQFELARDYGIEGFCFYFYWFAGKTLLERPLQMLLEHPEWDTSFCLCWANENWTRRWDGLDSEILVGQKHSPEDDLQCIEHLRPYLEDPRYIRVDGKPLLVLYRPNIFPDAKATVSRWRNACRSWGLGEIFVAYVQSFENVDPACYGMDAAIEFPPNNSAPPRIDPRTVGTAPSFQGQIYDWTVFPERSKSYTEPGYMLFRGVNPGWDNTPRRKQQATIFVGDHPVRYQAWVQNAVRDTLCRMTSADRRLLFVNAWNEWGEGAHLEPDQRWGAAYLDATQMAQLKQALLEGLIPPPSANVAIVVHVHYLDIFDEILEYLKRLPRGEFHVFVTASNEHVDAVSQQLAATGHPHEVIGCPNRGRDVLPFLRVLPRILAGNFGTVIKVHTKKSPQRVDGEAWRRVCFEKLLRVDSIASLRESFTKQPRVAIFGPKEYVVPLAYFWGGNRERVIALAMRLGIQPDELEASAFVAGTMFACRREILWLLHALRLEEDDFEQEAEQADGTAAHVVERLIGVAARALEMEIGAL
jgi:lipopolysaccharide biosynthesis protein